MLAPVLLGRLLAGLAVRGGTEPKPRTVEYRVAAVGLSGWLVSVSDVWFWFDLSFLSFFSLYVPEEGGESTGCRYVWKGVVL